MTTHSSQISIARLKTSDSLEKEKHPYGSVREVDTEDPEERNRLERRLLRKIDMRMSILVLIYIMNYIDRSNVAAARLNGFEKDLGLHGNHFATILAIYFVGYTLMQIPSNMFLNYVQKPSLYLPGTMIVWGMISSLTGITKSFPGIFACRFFLGFVEAAFFPGALLLLSNLWISACSGILQGMNGTLGHTSWRWLYYIEGAITAFIAIIAIFVLPDFPENTGKWFTPEERALAILRIQEDSFHRQGKTSTEYSGFKQAASDWKVWWLSFLYASFLLSLSFNVYFPTLTSTLGYNRTISLLLCAPPSILASILSFMVSRHSDKRKERFWHITGPCVAGIIGYILEMSTMNVAVRYVGLSSNHLFSHLTLVMFLSNTFYENPEKRSVALALTSGFAQLGAIGGSYIYPKNWGPSYTQSFGISLGATGLCILMSYIFKLHLASLNRQFEKEEQGRGGEKKGFRYML
ncbi:major facilitator superfamily domain-containing protein [Cyathus striatus]|nr:major facilitator superfamily domain-containing protein [Cyathus striatus]